MRNMQKDSSKGLYAYPASLISWICDTCEKNTSKAYTKEKAARWLNTYIYIYIKPTLIIEKFIIFNNFSRGFFVFYVKYKSIIYQIKRKQNIFLPVESFDVGFLFGSSSRLIRLSPSFISSHRPTGNLKIIYLKKTNLFIKTKYFYITVSLLYLTSINSKYQPDARPVPSCSIVIVFN